MATGTLPFNGNTTAIVFDAVLNKAPDGARLPADLQPIVLKALEKDREVRCQTASDLRADLKRLRRGIDAGSRAWSYVTIAALVVAAAAATFLRLRYGSEPPARSEWEQITNLPDSATQPALSPDGRMVAFIRGSGTFVTPGQIYIKMLPNGEPVRLTQDDLPKMSPVFLQDGSRIAYTVFEAEPLLGWCRYSAVKRSGGSPMLRDSSGLTIGSCCFPS